MRGIKTETKVHIDYVDAEALESKGTSLRRRGRSARARWFWRRGFEGKILAAGYAREHKVPYLGICYGLHAAVIDFARHCAKLEGAHSTEVEENAPHPVIALITEWTDQSGQVERRTQSGDLGRDHASGGTSLRA